MLSKKVQEILNLQIQKEDYSSQLYLSMASWAENKGYEGVSSWLYAQAEEERLHMLKLVRYVNERDGVAEIPGIETPPTDFGDVNVMFGHHQRMYTGGSQSDALLKFSNFFWNTKIHGPPLFSCTRPLAQAHTHQNRRGESEELSTFGDALIHCIQTRVAHKNQVEYLQ